MNEQQSTVELLISLDAKLSAVIALLTHLVMRSDDSLPEPPYAAVSVLLADAGLSNAEVGKALGKSGDSARKQINRDRKKEHE